MKDSWQSGDPYEYYMGRWSKLVAESFVDWVSPKAGLRWLDVGCGSGALSEIVLSKYNPEVVIAIDQSEGFVSTAQERLGTKAKCKVGDALSLPVEDSSIDMAVSGLVLNFIPEPEKALAELKLENSERQELRNTLMRRLPIKEDGSILLYARAWAVKGIV